MITHDEVSGTAGPLSTGMILHAAGRRLARPLAWLTLMLIVFLSLSPGSLRPTSGHVSFERMGAYAVTAALFLAGYPRCWREIAVGLGVTAAGLECLQDFVSGRHGRLSDLGLKLLGVALGEGLTALALPAVARLSPSGCRRPGLSAASNKPDAADQPQHPLLLLNEAIRLTSTPDRE